MLPLLFVAALTFLGMFLLDKGFTKLFRSTAQHKSGLAVRLPKRTATAGIILCVLALAVLIAAITEKTPVLAVFSVVIAAMGVGLIVYYLSFGIFYDEEKFLLTTFGKKSTAYYYKDIICQQLYVTQGGGTVVELHMADHRAVSLQGNMEGVYPFLDKAFYRWCAQKGIEPRDCGFHDPDNSCWFPPVEG